jgi:hypothetical protein
VETEKDDGPEVGRNENGEEMGRNSADAYVVRGLVPEGTHISSTANDGANALNSKTGHTTHNLPGTVSHLSETDLVYQLDGFPAALPTDAAFLPFDDYLPPPLNAEESSQLAAAKPVPSLLNNAPFPAPSSRTEWIPDFTFGPPSEHIDILAFLTSVEGALGAEALRGADEDASKLRPEDVAGWTELQGLDMDAKQELVDGCRFVRAFFFSLAFLRPRLPSVFVIFVFGLEN